MTPTTYEEAMEALEKIGEFAEEFMARDLTEMSDEDALAWLDAFAQCSAVLEQKHAEALALLAA